MTGLLLSRVNCAKKQLQLLKYIKGHASNWLNYVSCARKCGLCCLILVTMTQFVTVSYNELQIELNVIAIAMKMA